MAAVMFCDVPYGKLAGNMRDQGHLVVRRDGGIIDEVLVTLDVFTACAAQHRARRRVCGEPLGLPRRGVDHVVIKQEHVEMATGLETGLKWARDNYVREEMERQRRAFEEIAARRRGRDEAGVIVLKDSDDDAPPPPTKLVRQGAPGQVCSKDGDGVKKEEDDGGDNSAFGVLYGL